MAKYLVIVINIMRSEKKIRVVKPDGATNSVDYESDAGLDIILQGLLQGLGKDGYEVKASFEKRLILQKKIEE